MVCFITPQGTACLDVLFFSGILILFRQVYCTHADPYNHSEVCDINVYYIFKDKELLNAGSI